MANTPQRTLNRDFIITTGDAITGDDATGGAGGDAIVEGGQAATSTNTDGGDVLLRPGLGDGTGVRGIVKATNNGGADSVPVFQVESEGTNAHAFQFFTGTQNPDGVVSATEAGDFYIRSTGEAYFAQASGSANWVRLDVSSQWQEATATTANATPTTIATVISALADGDQSFAEVLIFGVNQADATDTYFHRQLITYYRDGGTTTQWTVEIDGREQRRGTFSTSVTAALTTSTNDVIVQATGVAATNIDWTVQYRTKETVSNGVSATGGGGGGAGSVTTVDKRGGSKTVTSSASSGGGTATGSISMGIDSGVNVYLKVTANGNTTDSDIEFWRDSGKTDQVYQTLGVDAFTSAFADGTPWSLVTASNLESQSLYYTITNNGANASTYDIELLAHGE